MEAVRVTGSAFDRGRAVGITTAASIARSVAFNRRYLETRGMDRRSRERVLAPYLVAARDTLPHLVERIEGTAQGAGVPFTDLFLANAFEEVYGILELGTPSPVPLERCTALVVRTTEGTLLLGHDEQWYAGTEDRVGLVHETAGDGPALLAPVVAGTLPLVGMNAHGCAVGVMSLSATDERVGVPRALVARDVLDAADRADAIARATRPDRAGGYTYMAAFADGDAVVIETTATEAAVLQVATHTNHALDPAVAAAACAPSAGSRSRLDRATELAGSIAPTVEGVRDVLADHGAAGQDICVHPDVREGDEGATIPFAMICEPATRTMWLTDGHPCTAPLERVGLDPAEGSASMI